VSPTSVPFTSAPLGKTTFQITTSVGRSLQTYDLRRGLQLVFLSRPQCPETITATCAYRDRVLVAWGGVNGQAGGIWVFKRGNLLAELESTATIQQFQQIVVFGSWIVACGAHALEVWKNNTYEHYTTIRLAGASTRSVGKGFSGQICTLPTYLNKVFVGRQDGSVEIYNISTAKLVHTIFAPSPTSGPVTTLQPAYADGSLCLFDIDTDEIVISVKNRNAKAITSVTFRTDGLGAGQDGRKDGVMATASLDDGDIIFWDLNRGAKVAGILRSAHESSNVSKASGVTKVEFLPGQNVVVSSGLDNALRSWILDQHPFSSIPRLLHSRSGHGAPVTELMFLPAASDGSEASGKWLLSAGHDRSLWGFSLRKDGQNTELSQGNVKHKAKKVIKLSESKSAVEDFKAPPIVDIACCLNRDGGMGAVTGPVWANNKNITAEESSMTGWESVVTAHANDKFARTWSWGKKKAGRWTFESSDGKPVTSVAITACGTFALVGSAGGAIDMFNLQSGTHRQRFPPRLKAGQAKRLRDQLVEDDKLLDALRGHKGAITGIVVDNLNQTVFSSSLDGTVIFWDFATGKIAKRLTVPSAAALRIRYNSVSNLIASSCDDLSIRIIDIESHRIVRELWGCVGQINDLCFSHDGRWVVACSMDSVVRVFDLATGHLIDAFRTSTCTNVAFSSTGEYLATTHAGALGINIWTNKSLYTHIATRQVSEEAGIIDLTSSMTFEPTAQLAITDMSINDEELQESIEHPPTSIDQLDSSLLTLSLVPRSRWQTLLNLDAVRQRNKPMQPPEKPKAAPFFLGSSLSISSSASPQGLEKESDRRISKLSSVAPQPSDPNTQHQVFRILRSSDPPPSQAQALIDYLVSLPPSATDLLLRSLSFSELPTLIHILTSHLSLHRDYDLVNTWMAVLLKIHGDYISEVDDLKGAVAKWRAVNEAESKRLDSMVGYASGVVGGWLRSAR
jgi:U3 small nucleolar RNA-associated protein 21